LFAGVADREVPCRVKGCTRSWTWYGTQQIRALGQDPPKRMCDEHLAELNQLEDREIRCRAAGCQHTWTWKRGAQLHQLQKNGGEKLGKPPSRLCESCFEADRNVVDKPVECKVRGCAHTWTWTADAQRKHATWLRRERERIAKAEAAEAAEAAKAQAEVVQETAEAAVPTTGRLADESAAQPLAADGSSASVSVASAGPAGSVEASAEPSVAPEVSTSAEATAGEASTDLGVAPEVDSTAQSATGEVEGGEGSGAVETSRGGADAPDGDVVAEGETRAPKRKRRRRRKKGKKKRTPALPEGPPERMCEHCTQKLQRIKPVEFPCKVHGCKNEWTWERGGQLGAWVALGTDDLDANGTPPRRMCNSCRDFCRGHSDRAVACGRRECERTWLYKTGAQLQDQLAGRTAEPIRLCDECAKMQFLAPGAGVGTVPSDAEVMPCVVPGCTGTWLFAPGMVLAAGDHSNLDTMIDRMCDPCRNERGHAPRAPAPGSVPSEPAAAAEESTSETTSRAGVNSGPSPANLSDSEGVTANLASEVAEESASTDSPSATPTADPDGTPPSSADAAEAGE
jgi:hypothetical protein